MAKSNNPTIVNDCDERASLVTSCLPASNTVKNLRGRMYVRGRPRIDDYASARRSIDHRAIDAPRAIPRVLAFPTPRNRFFSGRSIALVDERSRALVSFLPPFTVTRRLFTGWLHCCLTAKGDRGDCFWDRRWVSRGGNTV